MQIQLVLKLLFSFLLLMGAGCVDHFLGWSPLGSFLSVLAIIFGLFFWNQNAVIYIGFIASLNVFLKFPKNILDNHNVDLVTQYFVLLSVLVITLCAYIIKRYYWSLEDYKDEMERELDLARRVQSYIIPTSEEFKDSDYIVKSFSQGYSKVGGDLWGYYKLSKNKMAFYMLDCSGNGVSAALNVFRVHAIMFANMDKAQNPKQFLEGVNTTLRDLLEIDSFVTMFYGVIDTKTNKLKYSSAASTPQFVINDDDVAILDVHSYPLGVVKEPNYEECEIKFNKGDSIILYSDGILEIVDKETIFEKQIYLSQILLKHINSLKSQKSSEKIEDILSKNNINHDQRIDDMTLVSVSRKS